ncbi:hypothetical protein AKO1_008021, partial [Acrasis kona]
MSLAPFHLNCPFTNTEICRCDRYLQSKKEAHQKADAARRIYQLYVKSNPDYEKEFGLCSGSSIGPSITYRIKVDGKTAGIKDPNVMMYQGPPLPAPQQRNISIPQNNNIAQVPHPHQQNNPSINQPWQRFPNPTNRTAPTTQVQPPPTPQTPISRPPLPQPTQPRTPFNNSNIKIISSSGANISTPAPPPSLDVHTSSGDGVVRTLNKKRNRMHASSPTTSSEPKKRGRPRKRRVCERCDEGEQTAQEYGKDRNILQCVNCKTCIHTFCHDPNLDHVPADYRKVWRCEDCKICEICAESGDEEQILICEVCDRGFHTYCLQPALEQIPKGSWMCQDCKQPRQQTRYVQAPPPQINYNNAFMNQYAQMQQMQQLYGQQLNMTPTPTQHMLMNPFELQLEDQDEARRIK